MAAEFNLCTSLLLLMLGLLGQGSAEQCLTDAIPESERNYIKDNQGNDISIGVLYCNWQSSFVLNDMAVIFIQEVLGYHSHIHPVVAQTGGQPVYALGGCSNFENATLRSCGEETKIHVSLDTWIGSYAATQEAFVKEYPDLAAVDLGSMGYDGEETIYLPLSPVEIAQEDSGLALDFYKSYNTSHHNPKKYFDSLSDVNSTELVLCNESDFSDAKRMNAYAQFSGDYEGMTQQADGSYFARCPDGRWWPAPACRDDLTKCIPTLTTSGWKLQAMMQWVTAYGFPAAIGMSDSFGTWTKHVASTRCLHYWWVPDATFIAREPQGITFPKHSPSEWAQGNKRTGGTGSYVSKMVSSNLPVKAPLVKDFVAEIKFELPEVMDLLLEQQQSGATNFETSCNWIKKHRSRWTTWIPDQTKCAPQFGLYNEKDGVFVSNRSNPQGITCALTATVAGYNVILQSPSISFSLSDFRIFFLARYGILTYFDCDG